MIKVFYSGVWDLLHYGHLRALTAARELGDWLTVGVIADDYEWSLICESFIYKGAPTLPYERRAEVVAGLRCVDEIVPHHSPDDNVDFMIERGFSIRAYGPEHVANPLHLTARNRLESMGVKYVLIPRTPNISTTIVRERIRS